LRGEDFNAVHGAQVLMKKYDDGWRIVG
jgi:hypothetical protein